jgi:hypothetical protein
MICLSRVTIWCKLSIIRASSTLIRLLRHHVHLIDLREHIQDWRESGAIYSGR